MAASVRTHGAVVYGACRIRGDIPARLYPVRNHAEGFRRKFRNGRAVKG